MILTAAVSTMVSTGIIITCLQILFRSGIPEVAQVNYPVAKNTNNSSTPCKRAF